LISKKPYLWYAGRMIAIERSSARKRAECKKRVTPKPPAGVGLNPLKDLDLTRDRRLDFLPPGLDFLPPDLDFLPTGLDFLPPSLEFLPSGLERFLAAWRRGCASDRLMVLAGGGRLGSSKNGSSHA
jgi:hypothetical protein